MNRNQVFSRQALEKLRSPDRLDTLIAVTNPIGWMGLAAICILLLAVLLWSFFGAFTVKADGMGLIMDSAGIVSISHAASGKIRAVYVKTGSQIRKGEIIARMEQPDQNADTRIAQYGADLAANDREVIGRVYQYDARLHQQEAREAIYSAYDGIVDEVLVEEGSIISAGSPLCTIRLTQDVEELSGVLYVPVDKGKRIEPGMLVQLAPNGVDVSKSGSLIGVVRAVSQYPVTGAAMQKGLGNPQLAQWIMNQKVGAAVEVRFDLVRDEDSPSGYLWTSSVGDHKPITPGSYCTGSIVIEREPPIERIFYKFSQMLRSR